MKLTQKKIDDYNIELTIEVEAENFSKAIKNAAKRLADRVTIKGFRKGKVPQAVLEKHIGKDAIVDEAAELVIQNSSRDAFRMLNLIPITEPQANVTAKEDGKDFVYTVTFTPYPQVKLGEYKNLDAEKVVEPVTDEQIAEQLDNMRSHHANLIVAADGDAIVNGDFITLDYTGTINGEKFAGGEAKDQPLEIGSHSFIGDFEEQLIGAKVGDELTVKVTFPDEYHAKDLAGRDAEFACKINSIKHRELPALDDEFAKKVSTFQTLDEYKADIRKNMEANAERRAVETQRQAIIDKAVANMTVDVPPVMIEDRITQMINELSANLQMQGMKLEQYMAFSGVDMDKMREDYRETARKNVLTDLLLEKVADTEKLQVEQPELNLEIAMMAQMYNTPPKQIAKFLQENGQLPGVVNTIRRRKAMKFILDNMAGATKADEKSSIEKVADETVAKVETPATEKPAAEKSSDVKKVDEAPAKVESPAETSVKVDEATAVDEKISGAALETVTVPAKKTE